MILEIEEIPQDIGISFCGVIRMMIELINSDNIPLDLSEILQIDVWHSEQLHLNTASSSICYPNDPADESEHPPCR